MARNPLPKGAVGVVVDPKTHKRILVYRKKGEKKQAAIARVAGKHQVALHSGSGEPEETKESKEAT